MSRSLLFVSALLLAPLAAAQAPTATVFTTTLGEQGKVDEVSTEQLREILKDPAVLVLDTRPRMEWAVSHIPGALNVAPKPGMTKSQYVSDVAEIERIVQGDKNKALVLYCNGPLCSKSKRLGEELLEQGFTNVRRYQLGAPVWRALGGVMVTEPDALKYVLNDRTAWWVDARDAAAFAAGSLPGARNIPLDQVKAAKDDGRLPMDDHNTRLIVFADDPAQARAVAEVIAKNAFHNTTYFSGTAADLLAATR